MKLLLDTHAFVWTLFRSPELSSTARDAILSPGSEVFVSSIVAWEIAVKHAKGLWPQVGWLLGDYDEGIARSGFRQLSFTSRHARLAPMLPGGHKDPFDRALAAQAMLEDMVLISNDQLMDGWPIRRLW